MSKGKFVDWFMENKWKVMKVNEERVRKIKEKLMQTRRLKVITESGKVIIFRCYAEHICLLQEALDNVLTIVFSDELYAEEEDVKGVQKDGRSND